MEALQGIAEAFGWLLATGSVLGMIVVPLMRLFEELTKRRKAERRRETMGPRFGWRPW